MRYILNIDGPNPGAGVGGRTATLGIDLVLVGDSSCTAQAEICVIRKEWIRGGKVVTLSIRGSDRCGRCPDPPESVASCHCLLRNPSYFLYAQPSWRSMLCSEYEAREGCVTGR